MDSQFVTIPAFGIHQPISALLHLAGAAVFGLLTVRLVSRARSDSDRVVDHLLARFVFALSCVSVLAISGAYHSTYAASPWREVLRRVDHAAIFVLIAGTLTLYHALVFRGSWRWVMVVVAWAFALVAIGLKLLFFDSLTGSPGLALYVGVSSLGVVSILALPRRAPRVALLPLLCGAVAYAAGALVDVHELVVVAQGFVGPHEIFHAAVLVGVGFHWSGLVATGARKPTERDDRALV